MQVILTDSTISPFEINAFIRRYIINLRSVIADPVAEKQTLDFIYSTSTQKTVKFLNEYFHENSPFKMAQQNTVEIQINAIWRC